MKLKHNVDLTGLRPELVIAFIVANDIYKEYDSELVITSVNDSKHSATSLHFSGCAIDLRISTFDNRILALEATHKIKERLGNDFDVILEDDHIHIEWQPKR